MSKKPDYHFLNIREKNLTLKLKLNLIENDFTPINLLNILVLILTKIWIGKITSVILQ